MCWGDASEGALAERVQARPAALVRAAADCIRAASMPHVYPAEAVYRHAALRDRLMKHDDDSRQLRDEKLRLLADDRLQAISECADYVNSRLSSVLRAEDPVSAKRGRRRQGAPAVLRIMCRWALSLSKSVALVVSNARASYVATAGVMQLLLSRLQRRVSTILDTVLLPPRTLSAVHFLSAPPQCSRRMKPNVPREMLLVLLDQINRKYNVQSSASSSGREGYIDIRTQPHLLFLQSSRRSALDSCLWDMMGAADEGLALSGLRACRQQIGESLRVRHRQLSVFEDAFGLEGLAAHRYRVATSLEDNHVILEDLLR